MNKRDKAIAFRLVQLGAVLAVLILGVGALAQSAGEGTMMGISNKLFFGIVGVGLVIYVALSFSKFMFKNLPSAYEAEEKEDSDGMSAKTIGRVSELKYSEPKRKARSDFDKYYAVGKK